METVIRSNKRLSWEDVKELWRYRELFYFLAWRDIKLRYKQTVFGIGWAVGQPLMMMVVFSVVFGAIAKVPSDNIPYPIFSYAGLLFWGIFSNSMTSASQSLIGNANIIQKVYLPKVIIPASSVIVALADFFFAALVFLAIMAWYGFVPHIAGLLVLPLALVITVFASLGLGWFFASVNVKYRDVRYVLPYFIQLLIYITPVIYPVSIVPQTWRWVLYLNPMTGVIESFKAAFLGTGQIPWVSLALSAAVAMIVLAGGLAYFLRTEKMFADII